MQTNLTIILNTHIPYVLSDGPLLDEPENWLFEAITETYIPLFKALSQWPKDKWHGKKIVISMTPCLASQLMNCKERYLAWLHQLKKIALFEIERTHNIGSYNAFEKWPQDFSPSQMNQLNQSAHFYLSRINDCLEFMAQHDLIGYLKGLAAKLPQLELWTSTPNHNFLPFFEKHTASYLIQRGVDMFKENFGREPDGLWLPECAFMPGIEDGLIEAGIKKTAMTPHAIGIYNPDIKSGIYQHKDLKILVHDFRIAMHIWKAPVETLPSHPIYREFYRDMGLDVKPEYFDHLGIELPPHKRGLFWSGIKYHATTDYNADLGKKVPYDLSAAKAQVAQDAIKFLDMLNDKRDLVYDRQSFIVAFDTELFGHWWHEGVSWLEQLLLADFAEYFNEKESRHVETA